MVKDEKYYVNSLHVTALTISLFIYCLLFFGLQRMYIYKIKQWLKGQKKNVIEIFYRPTLLNLLSWLIPWRSFLENLIVVAQSDINLILWNLEIIFLFTGSRHWILSWIRYLRFISGIFKIHINITIWIYQFRCSMRELRKQFRQTYIVRYL